MVFHKARVKRIVGSNHHCGDHSFGSKHELKLLKLYPSDVAGAVILKMRGFILKNCSIIIKPSSMLI